MNFERVYVAFIADQGHTFTSSRRQESADNLKSVSDIKCEESINIIALLSLCGVSTIVTNRWSTSISSQQRFVEGYWSNALSQKLDALGSFSGALKGCDTPDGVKEIKKWLRLARVFYGDPTQKFSSD
jgi:hypothetical protein